MEHQPKTPTQDEENTRREKLLQALQLPATIAEKSLGKILALILLNLACAAWLAFYCMQLFQLSVPWTLAIAGILALPMLVFALLYYLLDQIADLPEQVKNWTASAQELSQNHIQTATLQLKAAKTEGQAVKLTEVFSIGQALRDILSFKDEFDEVSDLVGGLILVGNPIFLLLAGVSLATVLGLSLLSIVTGFIAIF